MGSPGHRRVAVFAGHRHEDVTDLAQVARDDLQRGADLQHIGRVHDVLGGRAPMHVTAGVAGGFRKLMHQRQDRVADNLGLAAQLFDVDPDRARRGADGIGGGLGHHAQSCLRPGKRHFGFDIAPDERVVGKHRAHFGRPEHVAKQDRIENRASHCVTSPKLPYSSRRRGQDRFHCVPAARGRATGACPKLRPARANGWNGRGRLCRAGAQTRSEPGSQSLPAANRRMPHRLPPVCREAVAFIVLAPASDPIRFSTLAAATIPWNPAPRRCCRGCGQPSSSPGSCS